MRYKKNMGRPSRYNQNIAEKLVDFISRGLTVKDSCRGCNISEDTFSRWRKSYPDFNRRINESSPLQWQNAESLAKYGYRAYKRNQKPTMAKYSKHTFRSIVPMVKKEPTFNNLQVRESALAEMVEIAPYFNKQTNQVEWIDKQGIFQTCQLECYQKKMNRARILPFVVF